MRQVKLKKYPKIEFDCFDLTVLSVPLAPQTMAVSVAGTM
jgi:hypothetical protein